MEKNKIKLSICGTEYIITSEDSEEYIFSVGKEVDKRMTEVLESNARISVTMAAVLTALTYCDITKKTEQSCDNLRIQIKDYLEDSSKSRMEADEARREIERMKREIQMLRMRLAEQDSNVSSFNNAQKKQSFESCAPISQMNCKSSSTANISQDEKDATNDILNFFSDSLGDKKNDK